MIRVVLDTNVLISGLLWSGVPSRLLKLVDTGHLTMCLNVAMLEEIADVLDREKFSQRLKILGYESSELISMVAEKATVFGNIPFPRIIKADPDDDQVLACATAANSSFVVTGDNLLLKLAHYRNIKIISPTVALKLFQP